MEMDAPSDHSLSNIKPKVKGQTVSIPLDLVMHILMRLSARDVLRSRSVCMEWNSLLRTPKFISLHYNHSLHMRHENASSFIYLRSIPPRPPFQTRPRNEFDTRPESITLTFFALEKTTTNKIVAKVDREEDVIAMLSSLFASCRTQSFMNIQMICPFDGLVCLRCGCLRHFVMYNPATRESQVLPFYPEFIMDRILGVWFESTMKQQYKLFGLVIGTNYIDDHWYQIKIYDSTLNSWRESETMYGEVISNVGLLLNGVLHFQIYDYGDYNVSKIVTFDARLETFGHFEFPSYYNELGIAVNLLTFHGNLAFMELEMDMDIDMDMDMVNYNNDLWVMTEYGVEQSWRMKTLGPFEFPSYCMNNDYRRPLAFWKNKDGQDELLILAGEYTLSFNLITLEKTDLNLSRTPRGHLSFIPYNVETLLSLK